MVERKSTVRTKSRTVAASAKRGGGIELYFKRIFALMFGAVGVTALAAFATMATPLWGMLFTGTGMSVLFYILMFGGMGVAIWAQTRAVAVGGYPESVHHFGGVCDCGADVRVHGAVRI